MPWDEFSEDALHEAARARTGLDDFGDPAYLEGLRVLIDAYRREARFTPVGAKVAEQDVVRILATRLSVQKQLADDPAILDTRIERPLVVLGLIRTGSTALHHLLGRDPDRQVIEYWLAGHPQPRPPREQWQDHPDFRAAVAELEFMYQADPSLKAIHYMAADVPEECRHFLAQTFTDDSFEVNATVPSYTAWYEEQDLRAAYLHHRDLLELVGSTTPERRWILKYPVHMKNLATLLEVYPDACVVQTHRDPSRVMSSYVSLISGFRTFYEKDFDRDAIAREQLEIWAAAAERAIRVRRERDPKQFFDLHFHDFMADPVAAVKRIYAHFGIELSPAGEAAMRDHVDRNPRDRHGEHRHAVEAIGIRRREILDRFAAYMEHFGIEAE